MFESTCLCAFQIPGDLQSAIARWEALKRWERREVAQRLRGLGMAYREIGAVIPVGKGSLSKWCRDVALTEDQKDRLIALNRRVGKARREAGWRRRLNNLERIEGIKNQARLEAARLISDRLWLAGVVAYWAEGTKGSGEVEFANSDPALVKLFLTWAERFLDRSAVDCAIRLHLHSGQDESESIRFWSGVTNIPAEQFGKTFIKTAGTGHRKKLLYHGTAQIRLRRSSDLLHKVLAWIEAVGHAHEIVG